MLNKKIIINVMAFLLLIEGMFMLISFGVSVLYGDKDMWALGVSSGICFFVGSVLWLLTRNVEKTINKRDAYVIVSLVWIVFSLFGLLPFMLSGAIPSFTNAFFETISGFTTTGASILNDIEALPHGLLFWRSIIQWLGGMGIIVLALAILPIFGIGGMQLFIAEVPGPTPEKLHPRIRATAMRLWWIYISFTLLETILLYMGGMEFFDSICHSFTTMATGGYSTKQASIAFYQSPYIQYIITIFMFLAGTNFTLSYFALHFKFGKVFKNEEFRVYLGFVLFFTLIISAGLWYYNDINFEKAFRDSVFQVVSIITTTGFVTSDYLVWPSFLTIIIFALMFFGGSQVSTAGGIKIVRITLLLKNSYKELKEIIHPNAIIPVRLDNKSIAPQIINNIFVFVITYLLIFAAGTIVISTLGYDLDSSMGAVASSLGNI
jgi:trk system potassium uptake protein TrkH